MKFALFYLAEFMNTVTMSAVIVTLFFGGPQPLRIAGNANILHFFGPLSGTVWFFLKLLVFLYIYVWFRATLPRRNPLMSLIPLVPSTIRSDPSCVARCTIVEAGAPCSNSVFTSVRGRFADWLSAVSR